MLSLSHREARGLASFLEVLASPLTFPDSSAWRREVMSRGRAVFRAERTVFTLDWEGPRALEEEGLDPGAIPACDSPSLRSSVDSSLPGTAVGSVRAASKFR